MNMEEVVKTLVEQYTYTNGDGVLCYDYCNNCGKIVQQKDRGNGSFGCEFCLSENISPTEVEE